MITQDSLDKLLQWLDSNREEAATKYERIRLLLTRYFVCNRGGDEAENLADKTIDRVARKLDRGEVPEPFTGDKGLYFLAFARYILREHFDHIRRHESGDEPRPDPPAPITNKDSEENYDSCLEKCRRMLPEEDRLLAVEYYNCDKTTKVGHHRKLAEKAGLTSPGLRTRMHRIRDRLKPCIEECVERLSG